MAAPVSGSPAAAVQQQQQPAVGSRWPQAIVEGAAKALCAFMIFWILVAPASWLAGWLPGHTQALLDGLAGPHVPVPYDTTAKYDGHTAVKLLHHLPGAAWSALAIVQHSKAARRAAPRLHRLAGRAFFLTAALNIAGFVLMELRGLAGAQYGSEGMWAIRGVAVWFVATAALALRAARARRFQAHRFWVARHIASGIWVAAQRLTLGTFAAFSHALRLDFRSPADREAAFGACSLIALLACIGTCEWYVRAEAHADRVATSLAKAA